MGDRLAQALGDASAPPYVIAEIGGNHGGRLDLALAMVDAAAAAGADSAKFQVYRTDLLVRRSEPSYADFRAEELPADAFRQIAAHCRGRGLTFLATPFDAPSVALLADLDVPAYKVASGDLTNDPLLAQVARQGRTVLLSTGAATLAEVGRALEVLRAAAAVPVVLLHCTAAYPAPVEEANLRVIPALRDRFGLPVGFSDHTPGIAIALGAVALGARIIEKHFTTDRSLPGGDNSMSILPDELRALVQDARRVALALGRAERALTPAEEPVAAFIRRSIVAAGPIPAGSRLTPEMLAVKRPAGGLPPSALPQVLGRCLGRALVPDEVLRWEDLA